MGRGRAGAAALLRFGGGGARRERGRAVLNVLLRERQAQLHHQLSGWRCAALWSRHQTACWRPRSRQRRHRSAGSRRGGQGRAWPALRSGGSGERAWRAGLLLWLLLLGFGWRGWVLCGAGRRGGERCGRQRARRGRDGRRHALQRDAHGRRGGRLRCGGLGACLGRGVGAEEDEHVAGMDLHEVRGYVFQDAPSARATCARARAQAACSAAAFTSVERPASTSCSPPLARCTHTRCFRAVSVALVEPGRLEAWMVAAWRETCGLSTPSSAVRPITTGASPSGTCLLAPLGRWCTS